MAAFDITLGELESDPYPVLARLREASPVARVDALGGWVVTGFDLASTVMRDAATFTVDDPRFTTAQVIGPSMLSLDGAEHLRHRAPFAPPLRHSVVRERWSGLVEDAAFSAVRRLVAHGGAELRGELAAPLAVEVVASLLGLVDVDADLLLRWYRSIVDSVTRLSAGEPATEAGNDAVAALHHAVAATLRHGDASLLVDVGADLTEDEVVSNAAVMLFGGIETNEGMTAGFLWHLLSNPAALEAVRVDPSLLGNALEESLRLEPAASRVDRYATRDVALGGISIRRGDLVIVSLGAANRDPAVFTAPDSFEVTRRNARRHVTFAQGPHTCLGMHVARIETLAAARRVLDLPGLRLDRDRSIGPVGLVFRKPVAVWVTWEVG